MRCFLAAIPVTILVACAGGRPDAPTPSPFVSQVDASANAMPARADDAGVAASDASASSAEAPTGSWHVETKMKGQAPTLETWPTFEHVWDKSEPFSLTATQRLCLPKGRYVFDFSSSPTLHSDIEVDGQHVITQRGYPSELSKPIAFDGTCKTVRVLLSTPHPWHRASVSMVTRPAVDAPPCDVTTFPRDAWSVCLFHGRNQEEPIGSLRSAKLESPRNQAPGRLGQFDWYSLQGRKTVCFDQGTYVVHSKSDESMHVRIGERVVLEGREAPQSHVTESPPVVLAGCMPVTVTHAYRHDLSVLNLAWAKVGTAQERAWAVERACGFSCDDKSICILSKTPSAAGTIDHLCMPTQRLSRIGEYCDEKHRCQNAFCIRNRCWED